MILSASTLGAPGKPLTDVLRELNAAGVTGIELRSAPGEIAEPGMSPHRIRTIRTELEVAGVQLTGLAGYVRIADARSDEVVVGELIAAIRLAHELGAPTVRVFPGAPCQDLGYDRVPRLLEPPEEVSRRAARRLTAVAGTVERLSVLPVIETHDSHPRGTDVAAIARLVDGPVGVIWDIMHPWRVGEPLKATWTALKEWLECGLGAVQIKDAALPDDRAPTRIGEGSLPCDAFARLLVEGGYTGIVSLELEAAWHPSAPPFPEVLASARQWFTRNGLSGQVPDQ